MRKLVLFLTLLSLVVLVVPVTAQDDMVPYPSSLTECEHDLTGEHINFYHFGDLSGPLASITGPIVLAYDDAMAYINESGILCGATVSYTNEDTGGDPERAQAAYDRFTSEFDDISLLGLYSSGDSELLFDQLAEDQIPVLISAGSVPGLYGEDSQSPGWIYATNPLYVDQMGDFCNYVAANPETFPDPVMGYTGWATTFGQAANTPEAFAYCESVGVEMVDTAELFPPGETDILVNIQNLTDEGANIIYVNALGPFGPGVVAGAIAALGIEDEVALAGVNWVMDTVSTGLTSQGAVRASTGLPVIDGMYGSVPFAWWNETDHPGIQFITEQADLNERAAAVRGVTYLLSWGNIDITVEALIQTINRVGPDNVTGAAMQETLDNLNYDALGGLYTADYQEGAIRDVTNNRIGVMKFLSAGMDGVATSAEDAFVIPGTELFLPIIVPLTDWQDTPDLRAGGADVPMDG